MKTELEVKKALLNLFNAVLVDEKKEHVHDDDVLKQTIKNGYVLQPYIESKTNLLKLINRVVGLSGKKANASFHKSWKIVAEADIEQLVLQQITHYITTYGFEKLGIYSKDTVYIPDEKLDLPKPLNMKLTVIKAMTTDEVREAIVQLAGSGIALGKETVTDVFTIIKELEFTADIIKELKNREVKALLYDHFDICPEEPVEYLRYVISKLTGESLLIKNQYLIDKIKEAKNKRGKMFDVFFDGLLKQAPADLASIFFRYKPLFLAMKSISNNKAFFNRLRKQANKLHKPLPEDYLNNVTGKIRNKQLDLTELNKRLDDASIFRKIRLINALTFRLNDPEAVVYRVRNGRGWATEYTWADELTTSTEEAVDAVFDSIVSELSKNVAGQTILIPNGIHYAVPATEKQFTGHLPTGSYVSSKKDMIFGVHWCNVDGNRIDLDLSLVGAEGKIGWDGAYRSGDDILFSGDVTDAPGKKGASELFFIKKGGKLKPNLLTLNYYNYDDEYPVPCKFFVADEKPKKRFSNYMVDPNRIVAAANMTIDQKQNMLGLAIHVDGENRIYFGNINIGNSISSSFSVPAVNTRKYMVASLVNSLSLKKTLKKAGAKVVKEKPEGEFVDLSPESLDKTSIIKLLV